MAAEVRTAGGRINWGPGDEKKPPKYGWPGVPRAVREGIGARARANEEWGRFRRGMQRDKARREVQDEARAFLEATGKASWQYYQETHGNNTLKFDGYSQGSSAVREVVGRSTCTLMEAGIVDKARVVAFMRECVDAPSDTKAEGVVGIMQRHGIIRDRDAKELQTYLEVAQLTEGASAVGMTLPQAVAYEMAATLLR